MVLQQLAKSDSAVPAAPPVHPFRAVYNAEAIIPPMCYTRTEGRHNPCYVCHQDRAGDRPNRMNDADLQQAYSFSELGTKNHWSNLFEDRSARVAAISDEEILAWVEQDNYSELACRLQAEGFDGYVPDLANLQLGAGAQEAYKGHPIICTTGDAGIGYTIMEIDTLAKYRLPAVVIVYNNNAWGTWVQATREPRAMPIHLFQENLRYDRIAEALGGHGEYVTKPGDFRPALERAYQIAVQERRPSVINCQGKKEFWLRDKYPPGMLGKIEPGCMSYYH